MPIILWDASGLVKRFGREAGSEAVDAVFQSPAVEQMSVTLWGYAECIAILHRKRNGKLINAATYASSVSALQQEVLISSQFKILTIEDDRMQSLPAGSPTCLLVAADKRRLRAAEVEGLGALNPEALAPQDIAARLRGETT